MIAQRARSPKTGSRTFWRSEYSRVVAEARILTVRPLVVREVNEYLSHVSAVDSGSGVDGSGHSHPYSRSDPFDIAGAHDREVTRWSTAIDDVGWRRAWGLFDQAELVGHLYLAGGALRCELHRADMGMGIVESRRRQGGGTLLLETAIAWARQQPTIDWIDLGVFSDNQGAQALYEGLGFLVLGHTPDRYRVDGHSLNDTSMTMNVRTE